MKWGIRSQILLALSLALGFGLLTATTITSEVTREAVLQGQTDRLLKIADIAKDAHAQGSLAAINRSIAPDRAIVLDDDGHVLAPPGDALPSAWAEAAQGPKTQHIVDDGDGQQWHLLQVPLTHPQATRLIVLTPMTKTNERVEVLENLLHLFTGLIIVLAIVPGYLLLGRLVIRPLHRLVRTVERFGGDDDHALAPTRSGNEVQLLAQALEDMKTQLERDRLRIETQVSELRAANDDLMTARERLILTEKLGTVGTLAAGIAHEIGNPLAVLQGYGELLQDDALSDEKRILYAKAIEEAVGKASTIIRDLLEFARPVDQSDDTCDPAGAVQRAINLVTHQPSFRDIHIDFAPPEEPLQVCMNGGRLEQVVLNLLLNAGQAATDGGNIQIVVDVAGDCVVVAVRDDGPGIREDLQSQIFDPFFTTKEPGAGTGLGLAICHNIITSFNGTIELESGAGEGATFRLRLPRDQLA